MGASTNFRDLGGMSTVDGASTRWRSLYRGAAAAFGPGGELDHLGVKVVIDLRLASEVSDQDVVPVGTVRHHIPLFTAARSTWVAPGDQRPEAVAQRYLEMLEVGEQSLRAIIHRLSRRDAFPAAVYCTAGRDRTGIVIAALLALAGVCNDEIASDYALSHAAGATSGGNAEAATMLLFLQLVQRTHGGFNRFLRRRQQDDGSLQRFGACMLTRQR